MKALRATFSPATGLELSANSNLDAVTAYRNGCPRGARILIETADAAERLVRHSHKAELASYTK
jgi:hypothetical protein